MGDYAIRVEGLGKRYRIGERQQYKALRDVLTDALYAPARAAGRLLRGEREGARADSHIWALKDVSFQVAHGEVLGIIGRNGAGKSTLLKILSRITEPTEGEVRLRGRVGSLLEVGTGFHPELTGRENIYLNGAVLGMRRAEIERKFDEIVAFAEVETFIDTPVKHYSSGMYVRLAFSVAAHLEPEILLVDEVLAVGDAAFQKKCLGKMGEVAQGGRTVLFVSHNMGAVRSLCQRCILLEEGRSTAEGAPDTVTSHYLSSGLLSKSSEGQIRWDVLDDAPGCEEVRLQAIRLLGSDGEVQSAFQADRRICVEITYLVNRPVRGMRIVLQLLNQEGVIVLSSTDHLLRGTEVTPGMYQSVCEIPAFLLNHGQYIVRVHSGVPGVKVMIPGQEYLSFAVVGSGSHGSFYPEKWPGVVAPRLNWVVRNLVDPI